jgi:hypothetical protein
VLLLLGRKQQSCVQGHLYCLHYTLCLKRYYVACNLIPNGCSDDTGGWIISHRCSWITFYVLCCNAQVNFIVILMTFVCLLYSINCPTVIYLPSMLFTLWRDTTSELWTPVHSFTLLLPFTIYLLYLHSCKLLSFTTRYA